MVAQSFLRIRKNVNRKGQNLNHYYAARYMPVTEICTNYLKLINSCKQAIKW